MQRWSRRIVIAVGILLGLGLLAVVALDLVSLAREQRSYVVNVAPLAVAADAASLERGRHLVVAVGGCVDCHSADLGGKVVVDRLLLGRLVASNLTGGRGGLASDYSDADLVRAIRHGIARSGKSLIFMPSESFHRFDDRDLAALIAYLRSVAPVDRELPSTRVGPFGRVLHVLGFPLLPAELIDHAAAPAGTAPGPTVAYGEYLATVSGCRGCHGPTLAGDADGPGPNITPGAIGTWTEADFRHALRDGKRPDGSALAKGMPWQVFAQMSDDELAALWLYERSLPAVDRR